MRFAKDVDPATSAAAKAREEVDQLVGVYVSDPKERRELSRAIDGLIEALHEELSGGGAEEMSVDAIVRRVLDPKRSQLNRLTRGVRNPSDYVR
jgi:hypothetical protein